MRRGFCCPCLDCFLELKMATSPELRSSFLFCLAPGLKSSPNQTWPSKVFAGWSPPGYGFLLVFTHTLRGLSDSTRHRQLRLDWHPHGLATSNSSTHQHPPPMREPSSNGSLGRTPAGSWAMSGSHLHAAQNGEQSAV